MGASGGGRGPERQRRPPSQEPGKGGMNVDIIMEILDKLQFFGGQRALRELWADKPTDVQDADIDSFNENIEAIRDYIQQLEAKVPRWISVKENEKPRLRQDCLCICSYSDTKNHEWDYMMVLRWMGEGDNGYVNRPHLQHEGMNGMIVTHWMPLPEPPKED